MSTELVCDIDQNRQHVRARSEPSEHTATVGGKKIGLTIKINEAPGLDICDRCIAEALRAVAKTIHSRGRNKAPKKAKKKKTEEDGD